jgi:RNA 3'-phosphate cyclase
MACSARVSGAFDGSPDLRFEPGGIEPGQFRFEMAGAAPLVLQTALPVLALASRASLVEVTGGTHVPASPSYEYLARHWASVVGGLGLDAVLTLVRAGFYPPGGGEIRAEIRPWSRPASLSLDSRGLLLALRGVSGAAKLKGNTAERQRDAARKRLWEERRLECAWEMSEVAAGSPGSFVLLEAIFEKGRAAFSLLGERGLKPETVGDRAARRLLAFLEAEGAVDPRLADQLVVPLALARGGGRVTTPEVTRHLETVVKALVLFGIGARTWGRRGGPGGFEVDRC